MICRECKTINDDDALFCTGCGRPLGVEGTADARSRRWPYLIALLFVPSIALVAVAGYFKFFLPDGIAAIVNGEEIRISELDAAVARTAGSRGTPDPGFRYRILDNLILERLAFQEARKSGMSVSRDAIDPVLADVQSASGLRADEYKQATIAKFGSMREFEWQVERQLLIKRMIEERVAPPGTDTEAKNRAKERWLRDLWAKAVVRIAFVECVMGAGCERCNESGGQSR